jgi:putative membrane protein
MVINWHENFVLSAKPSFYIKIYDCMKKRTSLLFALPFTLLACNNESKDSVEQADSANEAKMDSSSTGQKLATDAESSSFMVEAANGGMAEVEMGQMAAQRATNAKVKGYGNMMVHDHSAANDKIKTLAAQRNVTLPDSVSNKNKDIMNDLMKKKGKDFDKAYINAMVKDHEEDIDKFKSASNKVNDADVKAFIDNTLPALQIHLDSAKAIQKTLK